MNLPILSVGVKFERDVVAARQRARQLSGLLGFEARDQTRIATAVSEVVRNAFRYAGGGRAEFSVEGGTSPQLFVARVTDSGKGIAHLDEVMSGRYRSATGMGIGLLGAKRLMDGFDIRTSSAGTTVVLKKLLPETASLVTSETVRRITDLLAAERPQDAMAEVQQQNQELMQTLEELRRRQEELRLANRELEDTNRGVVALYAELDERADHLRRADEVKTRFLSNMTHEFRTPVNSIMALAGLLLDRSDGDLTGEQERQVGYIRKAAQALSELVNDLLDLAKVEAGKTVVRPQEFEVAGLFGALRGMLRPLLVGQSVNLVFDEPEGIPPLDTDESKLSQILRNFISNALKFTERGEVRVSAQLSESGERVVFSVSDTGIGIAADDLSRIFQEFGQLDSPIHRRVKGTGLGLPLSKKLAELLGGSVSVRSEVGVGSTFSVAVPVRFLRETTPVEVIRAPEPEPGRIPILAIDDQPEDRMIYEKLLRGTVFQLTAVGTMSQGASLIRRVMPRAILLDLRLGHQDAWRFLAELKADEATAHIPVIIVTSVEDQAKAYSLGADGYGVKPVEREWLLRELTRLAHGRTALVIDDDETARYTLGHLLRNAGWDVIEAESGPEGLRRMEEIPVRAVFLDLAMPGMNGVEVLRALRAESRWRTLPVFISSSVVLTSGERTALEDMHAQFLPKGLLGPAGVAAALAGIEPPAKR